MDTNNQDNISGLPDEQKPRHSMTIRYVIMIILSSVLLAVSIHFLLACPYCLSRRHIEIRLICPQEAEVQKLIQESINILNFANYEYK